jgi:hypothetical protein
MNEVKHAMKSAHGRSFFSYSNGIVSSMKAMFVHEIDISGFVRKSIIKKFVLCCLVKKKKKRLMQPLYKASLKPG